MRVAVIGATGYVGGRLVPELLAAGHTVRCLARDPRRLERVPWRDQVEVVVADVLDGPSLARAFDGIDAVFYLVHAMGGSADFEQQDRTGADNTRAAAETCGVGHVVYLGGLGADRGGTLSPHLASRHEVGAALASGAVRVTELRAAVIIGSGSISFEMLRHLSEVLPVMVCPRWVTETRCQSIAIADVLHYLVAVVGSAPTTSRVLEIGGPDVLTYREMMDRYAAIAGLRRRLIVPVNVLSPRLSSHWINLVTPVPYQLAKPLVESLVNDVVVRADRDISHVIRHSPLHFDEAVARALDRVHRVSVATSWIDSAPSRTPASPMPHDPEWAGGKVYEDVRVVLSTLSPDDVFADVSGLGGERGWLVANALWTARGRLDKIIGGVGMRRGRRHPDNLRVGDALDFFRVEAYDPPTLLRLRAEMRVPGEAWLEWTVTSDDVGRTVLRQHARFHPRGIAGRLYWWSLLPFHCVIWRGLARRLAGVR